MNQSYSVYATRDAVLAPVNLAALRSTEQKQREAKIMESVTGIPCNDLELGYEAYIQQILAAHQGG